MADKMVQIKKAWSFYEGRFGGEMLTNSRKVSKYSGDLNYRTIWIADFQKSVIQMPSSYYLPGNKIVNNLSAIQIPIWLSDYLWLFEYQTSPQFRSPLAHFGGIYL